MRPELELPTELGSFSLQCQNQQLIANFSCELANFEVERILEHAEIKSAGLHFFLQAMIHSLQGGF